MALPAAPFLDPRRLSASSLKNAHTFETAEQLLGLQTRDRLLALGIPALDELLPLGGLPRGSVIELQVRGASGAATSFALCACRAAQRHGMGSENWRAENWQVDTQRAETQRAETQRAEGWAANGEPGGWAGEESWCAFIDPSASLFAPGVARLGVNLARLLVVRPDADAVERVAVRVADAKAVALMVVDLRGAFGDLPISTTRWQRTVRRLALAVKQVATIVLVITPEGPSRTLPLPVAMRLEFARASAESFELRVGKERTGRVSSPRTVSWSVFDELWQ
jgi:hypothetical protein